MQSHGHCFTSTELTTCVLSCTGSGRSYRPMSPRCRRCQACFAPSSWRLWISWRRSRKLSALPANGTTNVPWACPSWTSDPASRSTHSVAQWAWLLPWLMGRVWVTWRPCRRMWRKGWVGRRGHRGCGACLTLDTKEPVAIKSSEAAFMGPGWWDSQAHVELQDPLSLIFAPGKAGWIPFSSYCFQYETNQHLSHFLLLSVHLQAIHQVCFSSDLVYLASLFFGDVKVEIYHAIIASCSVT